MRHLLNTLYVTTEKTYLSLENNNVVIALDGRKLAQFPLQTLEQINYFGYYGASPALLGACVNNGIGFNFFNPYGKMLARTSGVSKGNVLLRKEQYRISDNLERNCDIAKNFIAAKIYNSRSVINRTRRDHPLSIDVEKFVNLSKSLLSFCRIVRNTKDINSLRGYEGEAATLYFGIFDDMILRKDFSFTARVKRPPKDPVNAMLSFGYTMLANDCISALEAVGLDAYVGFMHRDRPGRASLALDLMEEFRSLFVDRLTLSLINNRVLNIRDFEFQEDGACLFKADAKKKFIQQWQTKKQEIINHPFLNEKIPWGLVPFVQAQLLARYIRNDIEEYPAFLWK